MHWIVPSLPFWILLTVISNYAYGTTPIDADGDGISDTNEMRLGTNPASADSDCDSIDDGAEVGPLLSAPLDSDGDGRIDALESNLVDADADGVRDQSDTDIDVQIACGSFRPYAIKENSLESTTMTLRVLKADTSTINRVQVSSNRFFADSVLVDGVALSAGIELFDDGSNGDVIAGDSIYSRSGFTFSTDISDITEVAVSNISVTKDDVVQELQPFQAYAAEPVLSIVPESLGFDRTVVNDNVSYGSHTINIVNPRLMQDTRGWLGDADKGLEKITATVFDNYTKPVDLLIYFPDSEAPTSAFGKFTSTKNDIQGIGLNLFDVNEFYGAPNQLNGVMVRRLSTNGPTLHEVAHNWGAYLSSDLGFGQGIGFGHWGFVGIGKGQLGGFDPATLVNNGDGSYRVDSFGFFANGGDVPLYSMLELYTIGLAGPAEVPDILVPVNFANFSCDGNGCSFTADSINTVTIEDVIAADGARVPASQDAQTSFTMGVVGVSEYPLNETELAFINDQAILLSSETGRGNLKSFQEATRGRATLDAAVDTNAMSAAETDVSIELSVLPAEVAVGGTVTITAKVTNLGTQLGTGVSTKLLLENLSIESSGTMTAGGVWDVGDLAVGANQELEIRATVSANATIEALLQKAYSFDPNLSNNASSLQLSATDDIDTDGDSIPNSVDTDDDGDGVLDTADAFPLDAAESIDTDNDGTGNNADTDDDGDGVADASDAFPLDSTKSVAARLVNIATRAQVNTNDQVLIGGVIITGNSAKTIVVRARGISLADADPNLTGLLQDPTVQLFSGAELIDENDNWELHTRASEVPANLRPSRTEEAAILTTLEPGAYTAIVRGVAEGIGVGIVEIFEVDSSGDTKLINIATRAFVGAGSDVLIGGLIITGDAEKTVTVRARGPSLIDADPNLQNLLADPSIQLFDVAGQLIDSNDNWADHSSAGNLRQDLKPTRSSEAVITRTLSPGAYTAIVRGVADTTGVGIVEVFDVD